MNNNESQTFAERLKIAIGGESVHSFAKRTGSISDSALRRYFEGSVPGLDNLLAIKRTAGVTLDWLASGDGPMRPQDGSASGEIAQSPKHEVDATFTDENGNVTAVIEMKWREPEKYTFVSRLDVQASAGGGAIPYGENPLDFLAFQTEWLRARNIRPECAKLLTAKGDSMMETIFDGDSLLIDTSINEFKDNAIYVVNFGNMVLVKRIHARMNGSIQLISDNPRYPPEEVTAGEVDQITVAGRVMWFGRTM